MKSDIDLKQNELYQKALAALRKNNHAYAVELFKGLLKTFPDSTECRHYLLTAARENKKANPPSFFKMISEQITIALLSIKVFYFSLSSQIDSAIPLQENIVLLIPDNIPALYKLATLFSRLEKIDIVIVILEEIIILDERKIMALKTLAKLYFQNKDYQKAKTTAKILLNISPRDLEAENILNDIAALGAIEKGFDEIKPAI